MTARAVSRRSALRRIGAGAGALTLLPFLSEEGLAAFLRIQAAGAAPAPKVLSPSQYTTLEALVEAIIPADERSPGAKEARVADYIDLLLSESPDDSLRETWLAGLAALDGEAGARFGAPFARLDAAQVEALLTDVSRNEAAAQKTPLEAFFTTTKQATIHAYYTSEIGIHKELRYKGNQLLAEFVGCQTQDGKDCPHCGQKA
jgi:glucoside 3-dehydrogenase (cytochrome c) hitch-hiker subunit